jgi:hypothetical protein
VPQVSINEDQIRNVFGTLPLVIKPFESYKPNHLSILSSWGISKYGDSFYGIEHRGNLIVINAYTSSILFDFIKTWVSGFENFFPFVLESEGFHNKLEWIIENIPEEKYIIGSFFSNSEINLIIGDREYAVLYQTTWGGES